MYPSWIQNAQLRKESHLFNSSIDTDRRRGCEIYRSYFNLIPHSIALGEEAGTAAVQSIGNGLDLRGLITRFCGPASKTKA